MKTMIEAVILNHECIFVYLNPLTRYILTHLPESLLMDAKNLD